jgi:hypothetical protein
VRKMTANAQNQHETRNVKGLSHCPSLLCASRVSPTNRQLLGACSLFGFVMWGALIPAIELGVDMYATGIMSFFLCLFSRRLCALNMEAGVPPASLCVLLCTYQFVLYSLIMLCILTKELVLRIFNEMISFTWVT